MITLQDILALDPCYDPIEVEALWARQAGDRESVRPSELVGVVHDEDAMWVLTRLAPERVAREAACDWAERAMHLSGVTDERSWTMNAATASAWDAAYCAAAYGAVAVGTAGDAAYRGMLLDLVERMEAL